MATFAELKADALRISLASDSTAAGRHVNDVVRELAYYGSQVITRTSFTMTSAASSYDLTAAPFSISNLLAIREVLYAAFSNTSGLVPIPEDGLGFVLDRLQGNGVGWPQRYALEGDRTIFFDSTLAVDDVVRLHYVAVPTDLSSDSDTPTVVPSTWHWVIAEGAAWRLMREEDRSAADQQEAAYMRGKDMFLAWANRRTGSRNASIKAGYPGRNYRGRAPHDTSQYPQWR